MKTLYESILDTNIVDKANDMVTKYHKKIDYIRKIVKEYLYEPTAGFSYPVLDYISWRSDDWYWNGTKFMMYSSKNMSHKEIYTKYYDKMAQKFFDRFGIKNVDVQIDTVGDYLIELKFIFKCFNEDKTRPNQPDIYRFPSITITKQKGKKGVIIGICDMFIPEK